MSPIRSMESYRIFHTSSSDCTILLGLHQQHLVLGIIRILWTLLLTLFVRPHCLQHHFPKQNTSDSDSDSVAPLNILKRQQDHLEMAD
ncbi:hypothetical protein Tco_0748928 [Tanacetum coccineum]|uniref:Uncharacterized protein n=1 Tax=Tanacetum coccineum TaxID=301880 RepID=A0ABQ4YZQ0_9ASTR